MSTAIGILKFIVACHPFAAMLLLVRAVNLKKANRGRQFVLPGVALVYCLVFTVVLFRMGDDPFGLLDKAVWVLERVPAHCRQALGQPGGADAGHLRLVLRI